MLNNNYLPAVLAYGSKSQVWKNKILEEKWEMGKTGRENDWVAVIVEQLRKIFSIKSFLTSRHHLQLSYFKEAL